MLGSLVIKVHFQPVGVIIVYKIGHSLNAFSNSGLELEPDVKNIF